MSNFYYKMIQIQLIISIYLAFIFASYPDAIGKNGAVTSSNKYASESVY